MAKMFPTEFRRDVVAVARRREAPITQIAKNFGISPACVHRWLTLTDIGSSAQTGTAAEDSTELRETKKRVRLLEQENEILRRAAAYLARDINPQ